MPTSSDELSNRADQAPSFQPHMILWDHRFSIPAICPDTCIYLMTEGMGSEGYIIHSKLIHSASTHGAPAVREVCASTGVREEHWPGQFVPSGSSQACGCRANYQHKVRAQRNQDAVGLKGRNSERCLGSSGVQPTPEPWAPGTMADSMSGQ